MTDAIKFTEDELKEIQNLQTSYNQITMALGQNTIAKHNIEAREEALKTTLEDTRKKEQEMAQSLNEKYGKGSLDIESGVFTPSSEEDETPTEGEEKAS